MTKKIKINIIKYTGIIIIMFFLFAPHQIIGQPAPPDHTLGGGSNIPGGGGAPLDAGLLTLIISAVTYGSYKKYQFGVKSNRD